MMLPLTVFPPLLNAPKAENVNGRLILNDATPYSFPPLINAPKADNVKKELLKRFIFLSLKGKDKNNNNNHKCKYMWW